MKRLLPITLLALASCGGNTQRAALLLEEARDLYETGRYNQAKLMIDSMRATFPKEFDLIREGRTLMHTIELEENRRTLSYCDSLIPVRRHEADSLAQGFTFEKEEGYEELGKYVPKGLGVERNVERCYIRTGVNEYGEMYIASVYYGKGALEHTGLRVEIKDGSNAQTLAVPYDGGRNYRFTDGGMTSEIVTYNKDRENGVISFIDHYADERIKVTYTGGKPYVIYLDDTSKKAIAKTSELALVLADLTRLGQEKKVAEGKIKFLEGKVAAKGE